MAEEKILNEYRNVAIVGASPNTERPSYRVASYLVEHGYNVIPVNPKAPEILGKTSYPDLSAIPEPVEVVDIFRRSEEVTPIVEEAIKIGAKAAELHFLHGCGWDGPKGAVVLKYVIHYADGTQEEVQACNEAQMRTWWSSPGPLPEAQLAWVGRNELQNPVCLYRMVWRNPKSDTPIDSVEVVSGGSSLLPFFLGVTAAQ